MKFLTIGAATIILAFNVNKPMAETPQYYAEKGLQYAADFPGLKSLCNIESPWRIAGQNRSQRKTTDSNKARPQTNRKSLPPTKVFDNLYYVGTGGVASWIIETTEGLIVIDALNNNEQAEKYIIGGMKQLGLNPKDIKYLVITHGHGDHYGGQEYLVENYDARVIMTNTEWTRLEQPKLDFDNPRWGERPTRDIGFDIEYSLKLGNSTVNLHLAPGHTPGTLSMLFPVYDQDKKHMAALWGGTGLNFGPIKPRVKSYADSAAQFAKLARQLNVDVFLSNHPTRDGTNIKLLALEHRKTSDSHPFVLGKNTAPTAFDLLHYCTYAQSLRIK